MQINFHCNTQLMFYKFLRFQMFHFLGKDPHFFTMIKSFVLCLLVVCGLIINKFITPSYTAGREDAPYKSINCDGIFAIVVSTVCTFLHTT